MNVRELRGTELVMKQPSKGRVVRALDSAEASFVAERELLGMRDKSIPRTIFVACGDPKVSGRDSSLVVRVVKRETNTAS